MIAEQKVETQKTENRKMKWKRKKRSEGGREGMFSLPSISNRGRQSYLRVDRTDAESTLVQLHSKA